MNNDGILYEDNVLLIRWVQGFLENPQKFEPGSGIEHIVKNEKVNDGKIKNIL